MKRLLIGVALLTAACSNNATAPTATAPTAITLSGGSGRSQTKDTPTAEYSVVFDQTQLGRVTITNLSGSAHRYAYYVWDATDADNQQLKARDERAIAPGQTAVITIAFEQLCDKRYQRDVYLDIFNYQGATSEAETRNYFLAAQGSYWQSEAGTCGVPPPPPVVTPPANIEGVQLVVPEGYTQVGNACVLLPDVVDIPPGDVVTPPGQDDKVAFCHVEYTTHQEGRDHHLVTNFGNEQNLTITLQAIANGHSDPAHHSYDHLGACTGQYGTVITPGGGNQ